MLGKVIPKLQFRQSCSQQHGKPCGGITDTGTMPCVANLWDYMVSWPDDTNRTEAPKEHNFAVALQSV